MKSTILWMPTHLPYWYHEYVFKHNLFILIYILRRRKFIHLTMPTCFILLRFTHICIFQHWRNKDSHYHYHLRVHCGRLTHTCVRNLTWNSLWWWHIVWSAPSHFLNKCRFMIWRILISESAWSVSVYDRYMLSVCYRFEFGIVCLLSVAVPALC